MQTAREREKEKIFFSLAMTVVSHRCSLLIDRSRAEIELSTPGERERGREKGRGMDWNRKRGGERLVDGRERDREKEENEATRGLTRGICRVSEQIL